MHGCEASHESEAYVDCGVERVLHGVMRRFSGCTASSPWFLGRARQSGTETGTAAEGDHGG